jgi:hypothetical protein
VGAAGFLRKPFDLDALLEVVGRFARPAPAAPAARGRGGRRGRRADPARRAPRAVSNPEREPAPLEKSTEGTAYP